MGDINFVGNTTLGKAQGWEDNKAAAITPISFPGKDSGQTEGVDTLGIIAYFNISGRWIGQFRLIQSYIASIKAILDGNQTSSQELKSPFVNSNTGLSPKVARVGNIGMSTSVGTNSVSDSVVDFTLLGIQTDDIVKNLVTGDTANVLVVAANTLTLDADIFTVAATPYAVTATINVKVLDIKVKWDLPALTFCDYELSVMQVK